MNFAVIVDAVGGVKSYQVKDNRGYDLMVSLTVLMFQLVMNFIIVCGVIPHYMMVIL